MMMQVALANASGRHLTVDDVDGPFVQRYRWRLLKGYVVRCSDKQPLARMLLDVAADREVDHRNRDKLDNRRSNLRVCTREQNARNIGKSRAATSSRFKGVTFRPRLNRWQAYIQPNRRFVGLGLHPTEEEAARAYDRAAIALFGEFAALNFAGMEAQSR